jgi:hypothetical protein
MMSRSNCIFSLAPEHQTSTSIPWQRTVFAEWTDGTRRFAPAPAPAEHDVARPFAAVGALRPVLEIAPRQQAKWRSRCSKR